MRPSCSNEHIYTAVFNLDRLSMHEMALADNSAQVRRRLRHSAYEIRPAVTGGAPALLVLGGCHDRAKTPCSDSSRFDLWPLLGAVWRGE